MQDPISDLTTQIRNGQMARKTSITLYSSKEKICILKILKEEGYILSYELINSKNAILKIKIMLKYYKNKPVIFKIMRVSRPGLRIYKKKKDMPNILNGFGIAVVSTSKGIMTSVNAKKRGCGGEILCFVE